MPLRLVSLFGLVALIVLAWALSNNRRRFPWQTVFWGLALQLFFAWFILKTPIGGTLFKGAQVAVDQLNVYANEGAKMVFGPLGDREALTKAFGPANAFVFAVSVSATIILISALSSLLYHWGVLQRVVAGMDCTAKLFRTWSGTMHALAGLRRLAPGRSVTTIRRNLIQVVKDVAVKLGNTPAICRRCYIHPAVIECYLGGAFHRSLEALPMGRAVRPAGLSASERLTLAFLRNAHRS
jgi:hypothetical protein